MKGLEPVGASGHPQHDAEVDAALLEDSSGRRWLVRAPRTSAASLKLDAEARLLDGLTGWLPFAIPSVSGTVELPGGGRAVVHRALPGEPLTPADLTAGPGLAAALGRALATIHDLPDRILEDAGMPSYEAEEYRLRRLAELDRAASTGHVPTRLLGRWERALEEAGAWRFVPCPVHGDLAPDSVLAEKGDVSAVLDWAEARVADPADDFAWLVNGCDPAALESVLEAYANKRRTGPDRDLERRARLAGELSLARWLLHGTTTGDEAVVKDAVAMLEELDEAVADATW